MNKISVPQSAQISLVSITTILLTYFPYIGEKNNTFPLKNYPYNPYYENWYIWT